MTRRIVSVFALVVAMLAAVPSAAFACGGLIAPGHAEVLRRASTLAAWADGKEHYITGFTFAGNAEKFGYLIPLPGVPEKIEKGGEWTLERLEREIRPQELASAARDGVVAASSVDVLQHVKIDALDIKILRGGGRDVAAWARTNGFDLDFNADAILGHYSSSKAIFAAAKFDSLIAKRKGLVEGKGQVIHFTIPTAGPWIPVRILTLGKGSDEVVTADLFVLTPNKPSMAPLSPKGMTVLASHPASETLLNDLRSDKGMEWVPTSGWFTAMQIEGASRGLGYDLSFDGARPVAATRRAEAASGSWLWWSTVAALLALIVGALRRTGARTEPA